MARITNRLGREGWVSQVQKVRLVLGEYPFTTPVYGPIPGGPEYPNGPLGAYKLSPELTDEEARNLAARPSTRASWEVVLWSIAAMRPMWHLERGRYIAGIEAYEEAAQRTCVEFLDGYSPRDPQKTFLAIGQPFEEFAGMLTDELGEADADPSCDPADQQLASVQSAGQAADVRPPSIIWRSADVRALIMDALDDAKLDALAMDFFYEAYQRFARGMRKDEKVHLLVEHCMRHNCLDTLVAHMTQLNPGQVARHAQRIASSSLPATMPDTAPKALAGADPALGVTYGTGNRWAVLVGVNTYDDCANYGRLFVCENDVLAVRDALVDGGFDAARLRVLTDSTPELPIRDNILVALQAVANVTEPDDFLLFYYSGHGDVLGKEAYLVARNGRKLVLCDTGTSIRRVKEIMQAAPARAKVLVVDACHAGADIGGKGVEPMSAGFMRRVFEEAEGMAVLASCKQGERSYEWRERAQSAFTHFWLEALEGAADRDGKGFVTVLDAARHVTAKVKLWASQRNLTQTPTLETALVGDPILTRYA